MTISLCQYQSVISIVRSFLLLRLSISSSGARSGTLTFTDTMTSSFFLIIAELSHPGADDNPSSIYSTPLTVCSQRSLRSILTMMLGSRFLWWKEVDAERLTVLLCKRENIEFSGRHDIVNGLKDVPAAIWPRLRSGRRMPLYSQVHSGNLTVVPGEMRPRRRPSGA